VWAPPTLLNTKHAPLTSKKKPEMNMSITPVDPLSAQGLKGRTRGYSYPNAPD